MNLFGVKKKAAPANVSSRSATDTILLIQSNLEMLDKREQHIFLKIESSLKEAREKAAKKDKRGAIFCLKRKKMYEAEVEKLQGARITLEQQKMSLEGAAVNIEVFKAVESGVQAMKGMRGNLDAARVDRVMDDIEEEKDLSDQISEAITRPAQDMFNDEELLSELEELEELEREQAESLPAPQTVSAPPATVFQAATNANVVSSMPYAPSGGLREESEEEAAIRALQASMM